MFNPLDLISRNSKRMIVFGVSQTLEHSFTDRGLITRIMQDSYISECSSRNVTSHLYAVSVE